MKTRFTILLALSLLIFLDCNAQRKLKKVEVEELGFNVQLKFNSQSNELDLNNLKFKIQPIPASSLNIKFLTESNFNGEFEYSHFEKSRNSYFLNKPKRKGEKSDFDFLLEGVDWLLENNKINKQESDELIKKIILFYNSKMGEDLYNNKKNISCNPYYISDKYLNVFELEIINKTNSFQNFNQKFLIETGNILQNNISSEELLERSEANKSLNYNKVQIVNKYNIPNNLVVPPNSKFVKYFAVDPINYNESELKISVEGINSKFKWAIVKDYNNIDRKYSFYEFSTEWYYDDNSSEDANNFYLLKTSNNIYISDDALYIGEDNLNDQFEILTLSLYMDNLYFIRSSYKGIDYADLDKNRRKDIVIKTEKINDLKKKVKY